MAGSGDAPILVLDSAAVDRQTGAPRRILVLKLDHFGDFVIGLPAFERLRQGFPDSHITLICGSWNRSLADSSLLFDSVRSFDHFPQNAKDWNGTPLQPASRFDAVAGGPYDLALDLRVDTDTRFLLQRVDARLRGGIGDTVRFPWLDIALQAAHQADRSKLPEPVVSLPPDALTSRMTMRAASSGGAELVSHFWPTNTCLLRSPVLPLPAGQWRASFAVGLSGRGFSRLGARMSFEVVRDGCVLAERVFAGYEMNHLAGGEVALDFVNPAGDGGVAFQVHAARRPFYGRFSFRGLRVDTVESLMRPRWQPSDLHVGEKLALLVALAQERTRDLYGSGLLTATESRLPDAVSAAMVGPGQTIVIAPLSNSSVRDWPLDRYQALISLLLDRTLGRIVLIGTAAQAESLEALCAGHPGGRVMSLAGRTEWAAMPTLLRRASLVICNNSGIAHLAAACGVATLAIYAASHQAREWGPRGRRARAIMADVACSPCGLEKIDDCHFGHRCMTAITPGFVAEQAWKMLEQYAEARKKALLF